jgi:putative PIN family toxin of toxin-antitoxin system
VFFDTNVLFAAFATRGLCADLLACVLLEHELIVGEIVLGELRRQLETKLGLAQPAILEIDALLRSSIVVPTPAENLGLGITDPDDEWVVAAAVAGRADVLVSGDRAVLAVAPGAPIPIVNPRGLWERLRAP